MEENIMDNDFEGVAFNTLKALLAEGLGKAVSRVRVSQMNGFINPKTDGSRRIAETGLDEV